MQPGPVRERKKGPAKQGPFVCPGSDLVAQLAFDAAGHVLCRTLGFLGLALGLKLGIAGRLADGILDGARGFIGCGFGFIGDRAHYNVPFRCHCHSSVIRGEWFPDREMVNCRIAVAGPQSVRHRMQPRAATGQVSGLARPKISAGGMASASKQSAAAESGPPLELIDDWSILIA